MRNSTLEINIKKTKALGINDTIMLQSEPVDYVDDFRYLGSTMLTNGGAEASMNNR